MNKIAQLRNACLETIDYCFGQYNDHDCIYDEMEFEFYMHHTNKPSAIKRLIFNALAFTANILLSL
jgi:hypothetical protein